MYTSQSQDIPASETCIDEMLQKVQSQRKAYVKFENLHCLEIELRRKRKALIGSSLPLTSVVCVENEGKLVLDYSSVVALTEFLASRTVAFWKKPYREGMRFCRQFFQLSIIGVANENVPGECLDNLILLSHALVSDSKAIFEDVMTHLLSDHYYDSLKAFLSEFPDDFYGASFEKSVLAAVSVFLGCLPDPMHEKE